jgi:hypothetical protein
VNSDYTPEGRAQSILNLATVFPGGSGVLAAQLGGAFGEEPRDLYATGPDTAYDSAFMEGATPEGGDELAIQDAIVSEVAEQNWEVFKKTFGLSYDIAKRGSLEYELMGWIRDSGVKPETLTEYYMATVRGEMQTIHHRDSWGGDEKGSYSTAVSNAFRTSLIENEHKLAPGIRQLDREGRAKLVGTLLRDAVIDMTDHYLAFSKGSYGKVAAGLVDRIIRGDLRSIDVTRVMRDPLVGQTVPFREDFNPDKSLRSLAYANPTALFFHRMKKNRNSKAWSDKRSRARMIDAAYEEVFPTNSRLIDRDDQLRNLRNQRQLKMLLNRVSKYRSEHKETAKSLKELDGVETEFGRLEPGVIDYKWTGKDYEKALKSAIHDNNTIMWQQVMNPERGRASYYRTERKAFVAEASKRLAVGKLKRHKEYFEAFDRQVKSTLALMQLATVEPINIYGITNQLLSKYSPKGASVSDSLNEVIVDSVKSLTKEQKQKLTRDLRALITSEIVLPDGRSSSISKLLEVGGWGIDLRAVFGMAFSEQMNIALDDTHMLRTRLRVYDLTGSNDIDDPIAMKTAVIDSQDRDYVDQSLSVAAYETALRWLEDEISEKDNQGVDFSRQAWDYMSILGEMGEVDALHFYKLHTYLTGSRPGGNRETPTGALEKAPPELFNLLPLRLYPRVISPIRR